VLSNYLIRGYENSTGKCWVPQRVTDKIDFLGSSVYDVINKKKKASNLKIPTEIQGRRAGDIPTTFSKSDLAETELGWKAEKTLDQMCKNIIF